MRSFGAMHDDYLDPDLHGVFEEEPYCLHETCEGLCDEVDDEYVCADCGTRYVVDDEGYLEFSDEQGYDEDMYDLLRKELWRISRHKPEPTPLTVDEFFECAAEGDFEWRDDGMCADWDVYACGDDDCRQGWHKILHMVDIGRTNGFRWVETHTGDEEGDGDGEAGWYEKDNVRLVGASLQLYSWEEFYKDYLADRSWEYFYDWAEYWLDVFKTGRDPCDQIIGNGDPRKIALKAVADEMKYLYNIIARGR